MADNIIREISYHAFGEYVDKLVNNVMCYCQSFNIPVSAVYGPPRGGLPISTHFAHAFNAELIVDELDSYITYINRLAKPRTKNNIIICDDVCDSGQTFKEISETVDTTYCGFIFCALFTKPRSREKFSITHYVEQVPDNTWLVFPWEHDQTPDKPYME